ncbi:hypothetical protein H0E82_13480 [Luteimonas sp. SJ-16]|uniref:DUF4175 domain-containing protein n=2 Tax=Luteimonas deserti TaxID=2752306 RepID=A0A7Z0QRY3_9GAMM|nr:hypothetical protein [Luteimonas deserti]
MPLVVAACAIAVRVAGVAGAVAVGVAGLVTAVFAALWRVRRYDEAWLARALDAARSDMEDSAALLFADPQGLAPLHGLQRSRLTARITDHPTMPPGPAWPKRRLVLACSVGAALALAALVWPASPPADDTRATVEAEPVAGRNAPVLLGHTLRIEPPGYTGLPAQTLDTLDAQAPEGAVLVWSLQFAPHPATVALEGLDGTRLVFARSGDVWTARSRLSASMLYRIAVDGDVEGAAARARPYRIDAVPDRPPRVRVVEPAGTLTLTPDGRRPWRLVFEAEDDYGVAADAQLRLTLTRGTGENVTFEDSTRTLRGQGATRTRRFETTLDPGALGLQPGGDLIAQLRVLDTRAPEPQAATGPSLILRWPLPEPPDADGLEGLARDVLPAYFRSQRQIIIDAEALIAQRAALATDTFATRSDTIGVDQRLLRLRYGQFLGEESEGAPRRPLPTADAEPAPPPRRPLPIDDFGQQDAPSVAAAAGHGEHDGHDDDHDHGTHDHDGPPGAAAGHDHDHDGHDHAPRDATTFGRAEDVLETFGHTHDLPEAATLLDPKTRELLRGALREMWQSELHLRQAEPQRALAPANRALELIKQVQQADRIYLARVGSRLPPVDMGRRLGGDRDGIAPRAAPRPGAREPDAPAAAWRALAWNEAPDLAALVTWAQTHPRQLDDPLALLAAVDALQRDPACGECRQALRGQLWQALQRPLPAPPRRERLDAMGTRYLDALGGEVP